jgi:hypothetical protein
VKDDKYCGIHQRDKYRDEEKEKGIKYCDIARGCFTILTGDHKKCTACLEISRAKEKERYEKRNEYTQALEKEKADTRVCLDCGKDFAVFTTQRHCESKRCTDCNKRQKIEDAKRSDRVRNYKEEHFKNLEGYYKDYINGAIKRGYVIEIDFETFSTLVQSKCYYCDYKKDSEINGIDRLDNTIGYTKTNCVGCCSMCNRMKHVYDANFFIDKCRIFSKNLAVTNEFYKTWEVYYKRSSFKQYGAYKKEAAARGLPFHLTQDHWDILTRSSCYLCGYKSEKGVGLDRVDNTKREYTPENVKPCCGSCNNMKNEIPLADLLQKAADVARNFHGKSVAIPKLIIPTRKHPPGKERSHWKSVGLYYAILTNNTEEFEEYFEGCLSDWEETKITIFQMGRDAALDILKTLIQRLKKRKQRAATAS